MSDRLYELMTLQDVAKALVISTRSVVRRVRDGSLPAPIKIGRHIRWERSTLQQWLASQQGAPSKIGPVP
jgi:excisionase family DNA binding protein